MLDTPYQEPILWLLSIAGYKTTIFEQSLVIAYVIKQYLYALTIKKERLVLLIYTFYLGPNV